MNLDDSTFDIIISNNIVKDIIDYNQILRLNRVRMDNEYQSSILISIDPKISLIKYNSSKEFKYRDIYSRELSKELNHIISNIIVNKVSDIHTISERTIKINKILNDKFFDSTFDYIISNYNINNYNNIFYISNLNKKSNINLNNKNYPFIEKRGMVYNMDLYVSPSNSWNNDEYIVFFNDNLCDLEISEKDFLKYYVGYEPLYCNVKLYFSLKMNKNVLIFKIHKK